ncbi:alpha-2-macroglobulin family protein [Nonlabens ulvanivorans]|nr:MG2 domain-containing protein [Nonlabens ulvanivorans]WOI22412.1 MG2 domain-containing protein [Nonlabens ulvanivorans]
MKKLILALCTVMLLFACKDDQQINTEENVNTFFKFREYVAQVSDNVISAREPIIIRLNEPVESWKVDMQLENDIMTLSPRANGIVKSLDHQTIAFVPDEPLEQDTKYKVSFKLGKVKDVPADFKTFDFELKTIKQDFIVRTEPVSSYDSNYQFISGSIISSDVMTLTNADLLLKATLNGKELPIKILDNNELGKYFEFKIDSIKRPVEDEEIEVSWNGKSIGVDSKGDNVVRIPGKNSFSVTDIELFNNDSQYILVNFSDPLQTGQNIDGLIQIEGVDKYKFEVDGNEVKLYPNKTVTGSKKVEVFTGIKSVDGYNLKFPFSSYIAFEQVEPAVELVRNGTILPSSQNLKINFKAVNLKAVDVWVYKVYTNNVLQYLQSNNLSNKGNLRNVGRPVARDVIDLAGSGKDVTKWNVFSIDLSKIIAPDPGALYRVEFKYKKAYSAYNCDDSTLEETEDEEEIDFDVSFESSNWDSYQNYYYDDYYYDYDWSERDNPCSNSFYRNKSVSTNVLASDLGITVKRGENNTYLVAINNILTTKPLGGARVELFNFQQQEIYEGRTNAQGLLHIDLRDEKAFFAQVSYNNQFGYVRLDDGNALPVSKFDTAGKNLSNGLKGYIYGERGVWRPGDHIYLTFVLNDADNKLPNGHPIKLELRNPNGKITHREVLKNGLNNFYQFDLKTDDEAPTGNWNARIEVGGSTFNKTLKIETIKPNRLKVKLDFEDEILKSGKASTGTLETMWLHGATAKGLKADITAKLYPTTTKFEDYNSYIFDDPSRYYDTEEVEVFNSSVNQQGQASFTFKPGMSTEAPGMLKASFLTKVYENGGDFSTNVTTKIYSPYDTYVGLDVPPGDKRRGMLVTDRDHKFDVVTVDENGKPKATKNLEVKVYKVNWRWWWQSSSNSLSRYESREYKELIMQTTVSTGSNGKGDFKFNLEYPEWGRYLVRVYDPTSGHATGKLVYVDWPGWAGKSRKTDPETASMLIFNADKEKYVVGENAKITFPSTSGGRALVTIENGTEVLDAQWVDTTKDETVVNIPLNNLYVPNVFVHITYLQPHAQTANDLPLRMYGVIPLLVENKASHLYPVINMPDELAPESQTTIKVSEKNGKAMTYTIAVVDEGLLDLTNFKTPNAWDTFFAREALGVKTWDIFDDVVGAYGGRIDAAFEIGGDGTAQDAKGKKANRFTPMVIHLGPFQLEAGSSKSHTIDTPRYVGSVRTMVVAGNDHTESYGNAEKTTAVKKPLMMLASLPRKLSPGETVKLPVTIFAMDKKVKNVSVTMENSPYFEFLNGNSQKLSFTETGDQIAYFDVKVKSQAGIAKLELRASGNGEKAAYSTEIDIVNPNPYTTISEKAEIAAGATVSVPITPFGTGGTNSAQVSFSSLPSMDLGRRLSYLIRYPHGCVEQTTSAAFPQLHLSKVVDLTSTKQAATSKNIKAAIRKLGRYQRSGGGFSYWPGYGSANDWGTSYAGHFLIEAEKMGYTIPISFKSNWIAYQKRASKEWRYTEWNDMHQAYRLYTLALAGAPDLSSMNRLRETRNLSNESKLRLAAAYALVGQQKAANELVSNSNIDFKPSRYDYRTYGSPQRNRAMALETMILLKENSKARNLVEDLAKGLDSQKYYSTQETAYSLLAISKYADFIGGKGIDVSYSFKGNSTSVSSGKSLASRDLEIDTQETSISVTNNGENSIFITTATTGKLPVGEEKAVKSKLSAIVSYTDSNGKAIDMNNIIQGTEITAKVIITNTTGLYVNDIALSQILPSGWEIVNTRFTEYGDNTSNKAEYTDIRDDRVNYYFSLQANKSITFETVINASYLGNYYLPGIQCEAMYDNEYIVRNKGQWVEIKR